MNLRRAIGSAVAGLGVAAVANRALGAAAGDLEPALEGRQRTYRYRGLDVAYTEAGDPADPTVVLLHGCNVAATSHEFRNVFDDLATDYHVVAPDLPGFGRSDRPPLRYSATFYEEFLRAFLAAFENPAVVATSLTGAYVAAVAGDLDLSRVVLIAPTTSTFPGRRAWLRELLRLPVLGEALFNLAVSKPAIRRANRDHGYYNPDLVEETWVGYEWRTAHQPGARFAAASFVSGHLNSAVDLASALAALDVPVTLLWGREATTTPLAEGRDLAEAADARLVVYDDALLLPHVEHGAAVVETLRESIPTP